MVLSGFISAKISHRRTILLSVFSTGVAALSIAFGNSIVYLRAASFALGLACGLYLPSGMATIVDVVDSKHWGKAISVHEIGYNSSFFVSLFFAEIFLRSMHWRGIMLVLGAATLVMGLFYALFARGGDFASESPRLVNLPVLAKNGSFRTIVILFALSAAASLGVYSVLPTYLVGELNMRAGEVNTLIGLSRLSCLGLLVAAGWLIDNADSRLLLGCVIAVTGGLTILLGFSTNIGLKIAVFLQPLIITCFFPAAFSLLARVVPRNLYGVSVSLMIPFTYFIGGGVVPFLLGIAGEHRSFAFGFVVLGIVLTASPSLLAIRRFPVKDP
jgi:NNP family nitrate/nitrite transporter-like MFS transporter